MKDAKDHAVSPAFVRGRYIRGGSARNPWKLRSWIQKKYGAAFDRSKIQDAHLANRVDFNDKGDTHRHLELGGIPNALSYTTRVVGEFIKVTTHASGKDLKKLQKLRRRLDGVTSFDNLSKTASYEIHVVYPYMMENGKTFKCGMEEIASTYHLYAHIRSNARDHAIPYFFGGMHVGLGAYVAVISSPPKTRQIQRGDRRAVEVFNRLVSIGAYPMSSNAVRVFGDQFIVTDPWQVREIPRGIFSAFTRSRIVSKKRYGGAWTASGGAAWAKEVGSVFMFEKTNFGTKREFPTTLSNTMDAVLKNEIKRYEVGASSRRRIDDETDDALTNLRLKSKHIGSGTYGDVYAVVLDKERRKLIKTLFDSLKNLTYFESISGKSHLVLKIEKLDRMIPLDKAEVFRLAGEAFVQNYVRASGGAAPAVFFSGTLANRFHVIAMQCAKGETLESFIRRRQYIPPAVYAKIDNAVASMLRSGVVHSDLHGGNILIDPATYSVKIIDFGFATIIPPELHASVLKILDDGSVRDAFEKTGLIDVINSSKIGYSFYYSDPKLLARLGRLRNRAPSSGLRSHALKSIGKSPKSVVKTVSRNSSNTNNERRNSTIA